MKLNHVQFIATVSFGGSLSTASPKPVGDRPGQSGTEIKLIHIDGIPYVRLDKTVNGKPATRLVPMTNVAGFEPAEPLPVAPAQAYTKK